MMKKFNLFNSLYRFLLLSCCVVFLTTSCEDEADKTTMGPNQGEMVFSFIRLNGYAVSELNEIASLKITLEKEGMLRTLPSLPVAGTADSVSTQGVYLEEGNYRIVSYKAFDASASMILDIEPEQDNEFIVNAGMKEYFLMPIEVNNKIDPNNILNTLHSICLEAFGEDRSLWPATWNRDTDLQDWENLEFEYLDDGSIAYITGITLDKKFAPMKKLSPAIVNFPTLRSLVIRDNALEELPANIGKTNIEVLQISNTNLSTLPESFADMHLYGLLLDGNKFTEVPAPVFALSGMRDLTIRNEAITEIPAEIAKLGLLRALNLNGLQITELPDVFDSLYRITTLNISNNKSLTSLPASIGERKFGEQASYLHAVYADGCAFTSIPQELISPKFYTLDLSNNPISSISKMDLESMTNLETLYLSGIRFASFPALNMPSMRMLVLIDCGLSAEQVDRTGMPKLDVTIKDGNTGKEYRYDYLFLTQEHYDSYFKGFEIPKN